MPSTPRKYDSSQISKHVFLEQPQTNEPNSACNGGGNALKLNKINLSDKKNMTVFFFLPGSKTVQYRKRIRRAPAQESELHPGHIDRDLAPHSLPHRVRKKKTEKNEPKNGGRSQNLKEKQTRMREVGERAGARWVWEVTAESPLLTRWRMRAYCWLYTRIGKAPAVLDPLRGRFRHFHWGTCIAITWTPTQKKSECHP